MTLDNWTENGFNIEINYDDCVDESPREYECSTFVGFHRKYASPDKWQEKNLCPNKERAIAYNKNYISLPVWLFDHSGTIFEASVENPFNCKWDSGLFGFIYISRADARAMFGAKRLTKELESKVIEDLKAQVKTYSQWANGEVYRWAVKDSLGEELESCGNYYDLVFAQSEAKECVERLTEEYESL